MPEALYQTIDIQQIIDNDRLVLDIHATKEECAKIAKRCDILEVFNLDTKLIFTTGATPELFKVKATLKSKLAQACVVTLAPVKESIDEVFNETLTTEETALVAPEDIDANDDLPVELIINGKIDIAEMIAQWLALSLNPYPRSDAPFFEYIEVQETSEGDKTHTPFDVLSKLKDK